ncbi:MULTISPECIES: hypothetical protein [Leptospira]|nr:MULTISPECIES: hypothetical protein [Leptospira]
MQKFDWIFIDFLTLAASWTHENICYAEFVSKLRMWDLLQKATNPG